MSEWQPIKPLEKGKKTPTSWRLQNGSFSIMVWYGNVYNPKMWYISIYPLNKEIKLKSTIENVSLKEVQDYAIKRASMEMEAAYEDYKEAIKDIMK